MSKRTIEKRMLSALLMLAKLSYVGSQNNSTGSDVNDSLWSTEFSVSFGVGVGSFFLSACGIYLTCRQMRRARAQVAPEAEVSDQEQPLIDEPEEGKVMVEVKRRASDSFGTVFFARQDSQDKALRKFYTTHQRVKATSEEQAKELVAARQEIEALKVEHKQHAGVFSALFADADSYIEAATTCQAMKSKQAEQKGPVTRSQTDELADVEDVLDRAKKEFELQLAKAKSIISDQNEDPPNVEESRSESDVKSPRFGTRSGGAD